jgi:hypothetical protein
MIRSVPYSQIAAARYLHEKSLARHAMAVKAVDEAIAALVVIGMLSLALLNGVL